VKSWAWGSHSCPSPNLKKRIESYPVALRIGQGHDHGISKRELKGEDEPKPVIIVRSPRISKRELKDKIHEERIRHISNSESQKEN
jgi:hypothetical protein